ncbi:unknown [Bacteroides sp. CAG:545]|nr:unknown [Bacteroides sp. CAG:545]
MPNKDLFNDYSNVIIYEHRFEAEKGRTGVWGYRGLANGAYSFEKVKSVDFIFVKDE